MKKEKKDLDKSLKLIVKSSSIVFIGIFLSKVFMYLYKIIIARYFGPEAYGLFSLAFMIFSWTVAISAFGLSEGLLRYTSLYRAKNEKNKINYIFKISSIILIFSSMISAITLFMLSEFISIKFFHNPELIIFLKLFSIIIPFFIFSHVFLSIIQAFEKISVHTFIFNIFQNFIKLISLFLLILIGVKTNAIIFSFLLGILSMFIISYLYCKYKLPQIFGKPKLRKSEKRKTIKNLISYSWPIMFLAFFLNIFNLIDSFSIGYFKGVLEVGFYNAAVPIATLLSLTRTIFLQLFFPLMTKMYALKNMSVINSISKQVAKWVLIINLPIFALFFIFPGVFINFLFGAEYLVAENALRFLSISALLSSVFIVSNQLLSIAGKSKLILLDIIIASVLNIILNAILVPMPKIFFIDNAFGITGAAIATMISTIVFSFLFLFQAKHYLSIIPLKRKMIRIFFIAAILAILIVFIKQFIIINLLTMTLLGIFFFLAYLLLIFTTGCLDENDLMILKSIKNKFTKNK